MTQPDLSPGHDDTEVTWELAYFKWFSCAPSCYGSAFKNGSLCILPSFWDQKFWPIPMRIRHGAQSFAFDFGSWVCGLLSARQEALPARLVAHGPWLSASIRALVLGCPCNKSPTLWSLHQRWTQRTTASPQQGHGGSFVHPELASLQSPQIYLKMMLVTAYSSIYTYIYIYISHHLLTAEVCSVPVPPPQEPCAAVSAPRPKLQGTIKFIKL